MTRPTPRLLFLFTFLALTAALATGIWSAEANGRASRIASEERGPYRIEVSILPSAAILNNTHVSILLRSLSEDRVLTDATVTISATGPVAGASLGPLPVPNDVTPQFYETNLPFDTVGEWLVNIEVSSSLGAETLQIPMNVREGGSRINWILMAAVVVTILAAGIWTWDRVSGRGRRDNQSETTSENA